MGAGRRLLMTADAVGGVWPYAMELAKGLAGRDIEILLATLGPAPSTDQRADAASIPGLELHTFEAPLDWTADSRRDLGVSAEKIADFAERRNVDLIQLNGAALAAAVAFPAPVLVVQHSCLASWWADVRGGSPPDDMSWRIEATKDGLHRVDRIVAPSVAFARALMSIYGLDAPPVAVHNGRKRSLPSPVGNRQDFVFTAGRLWDEGKNLRTLDQAADSIRLPIVAAGPLRGPNGEAKVFKNLRCPGRLSETAVAAQLAQRPIFVSPSLYEPFGLAVLEAAAAGCALVLSDIPTFRELWDGAALFAPAKDGRAFADAVNALAADPVRRSEIGQKAQRRATAFTPDRMTRAMLELYEELAPTRRSLEVTV